MHCDLVMCNDCRVRLHNKPAWFSNVREKKLLTRREFPWDHKENVEDGVVAELLLRSPAPVPRVALRAYIEPSGEHATDADIVQGETLVQALPMDLAESNARCFQCDKGEPALAVVWRIGWVLVPLSEGLYHFGDDLILPDLRDRGYSCKPFMSLFQTVLVMGFAVAQFVLPHLPLLRNALAWWAGACWIGRVGGAGRPLLASNRPGDRRNGARMPLGRVARVTVQVFEEMQGVEVPLHEDFVEVPLPAEQQPGTRASVVEGGLQLELLQQAAASGGTQQPSGSTALVLARAVHQRLLCSLWLQLSLAVCWRRNVWLRRLQLARLPRLTAQLTLQLARKLFAAVPWLFISVARFLLTFGRWLLMSFWRATFGILWDSMFGMSRAALQKQAVREAAREKHTPPARGFDVGRGTPAELGLSAPGCTALVMYEGHVDHRFGFGRPNQLLRPKIEVIETAEARRECEEHPGCAKVKVMWNPKTEYKARSPSRAPHIPHSCVERRLASDLRARIPSQRPVTYYLCLRRRNNEQEEAVVFKGTTAGCYQYLPAPGPGRIKCRSDSTRPNPATPPSPPESRAMGLAAGTSSPSRRATLRVCLRARWPPASSRSRWSGRSSRRAARRH